MLRTVLRVLKALGAFPAARWLTRKKLRILCYHGFSAGDEHHFNSFMYMRPERFESRLRILKRLGLPVISLSKAVDKLRRGEIDSAQVVITLDDGWKSNLILGLPLLQKYGLPATIYVITEHFGEKPTVFNMCVAYLFWKSAMEEIDFSDIGCGLQGRHGLGANHQQAAGTLVDATSHLSYAEKQSLLPRIAKVCGLDFDDVNAGGRFDLMDEGELQTLVLAGLDLQLHTHEHTLPANDRAEVRRQVLLNDQRLRAIKGSRSPHFCYPSGIYSWRHPDWLRELGISSATTCDIGLNDHGADLLMLKRILDRDDADDLFFEAEMCGVMDLMRSVKSLGGRLR